MHRIHLTPASKKRQLAQAWDLVERIEDAADAGEIKAHLLQLASSHGLSSLFAGWVPPLDRPLSSPDIAANILHDHEPGEWSRRYVERRYALRDPVVHRLQSEWQPFSWDDAYCTAPAQPDAAQIRGEASSFGLRQGFVVPVSLFAGMSIAFSFGGAEMDDDAEALGQLAFVTNFAAGQLLSLLRRRSKKPYPDLTRREIECLAWASEGKTDWEVAMITKVSRSTVLKHIASARAKLGAVSRTHAVVKAIRRKLIP